MLRALAYAEASGARVDVVVAVCGAVYPRLVAAYSKVADTNYAKVAAEFNATASDFTAAAKRCDPEADGDTIVGQPDPVREGWLDAAKRAARPDKLTPILQAAAELCGISTADETTLLPLLVDPAGCHRRRLWESWRSSGALRTLVGAGRAGCAHPRLWPRRVRAYRQPKPLIRKQFPKPGPGNRGIYDVQIIDPEDPDYVPPPEEPQRRRRALAR